MAEVRLTALEGNRQKLDGGAMFGNAPRALWQRWLPADELNRIELACRCLLVEFGDYRILCETGIGAFFEPKLAERYGVQSPDEHRLLTSLEKLGIDQEAITHVILSHLHFDHAGGLLPSYAELSAGDERLLFPKADYLVGRAAFARAKAPHPRDRASYIPTLTTKLEQSQRLVLIDGTNAPGEIGQVVSFIYSEGHTPGQMHTLIRGQERFALFCGDLIPGTAWLPLPITMGYDRYPEQLIDEKASLYQRVLKENWYLFFTHDPQVCLAECGQDEQGKIFASKTLGHCEKMLL